LANNIHEQFLKFPNEGIFKYSSILVYMFIFYQEDMFPFALQKINEQRSPQSIIFWTSLLRKNLVEYSFKYFIDEFIYPTTCLPGNNTEPRVSEEIQKVLHIND